ncbi:lysylphosphatidylglycerol synthase transmembrane domain-containing protein [Denitrobaculum tricleocarpae]|uniref:Flippase-like domain-containing protein n=1 Tax=Denitrobaculum tricleocarpae TaxID=2591009 RepID=A0A545T5H3_9PROT|nr:lysylphosphatidylglycerol synthase transmembrane domain-containing protein [Denitrobaculum tricleocarpae]TQV72453.1 flippase-like domain-containing protein [Denitrobaculum tricleocarpae]
MTHPSDDSGPAEAAPAATANKSPDGSGQMKPEAGRRKSLLRILLAVVVTAVFGFLFLRFAPLDLMVASLASASPEMLASSFCLVVLGQLFRGWRIAVLVSPRAAPSFIAYRISVLHNFLASLLPARLGELALPAMLKRSYGIDYAVGAGILLGARILDLLIILSVAGITFWIVVPAGSELGWLRGLGLLGGFCAIAAFLAMQYLRRGSAHLADRLALRTRSKKGGRLMLLIIKILRACAAIPARRLFLAQVSSLAVWLALFAAYHVAALAVTASMPVDTTLFAGTLGSIAFVLPINGIAQVGPFEAAWTFGGILGGLSTADALAVAVAIHGVTFVGGALQAGFVLLVKLLSPLRSGAA